MATIKDVERSRKKAMMSDESKMISGSGRSGRMEKYRTAKNIFGGIDYV